VFFTLAPSENHDLENRNTEAVRLMDLYGNDVLRTAYMYLRDMQRAEDVFQEVFLKVHRKYDRFRGKGSEKTWILSITINTCKDMLRSVWLKRVIPFLPHEHEIAANEDITERIMASHQSKELLQSVLMLKTPFKDVILLYYYHELSTQEIGKILRISEGTVRSRLHRGRLMLKKMIEGRPDNED
jgi:RNA polymerase sigma-70 factor (ECF subfamily)